MSMSIGACGFGSKEHLLPPPCNSSVYLRHVPPRVPPHVCLLMHAHPPPQTTSTHLHAHLLTVCSHTASNLHTCMFAGWGEGHALPHVSLALLDPPTCRRAAHAGRLCMHIGLGPLHRWLALISLSPLPRTCTRLRLPPLHSPKASVVLVRRPEDAEAIHEAAERDMTSGAETDPDSHASSAGAAGAAAADSARSVARVAGVVGVAGAGEWMGLTPEGADCRAETTEWLGLFSGQGAAGGQMRELRRLVGQSCSHIPPS